ncbi:TPA: restriction endonuclease subunit S [Vibrio alginolyticus]|uniref:restriction endonuclease subunit S n=1 Tax=Vibrio harveyi group TaxID=717610 RepID=UPI001B824A5C|nr:restriction endonuclease subunit S [Vibrio parahaemolyticus]EGQ9111987.1 restriction endonuclease subunit S [Vibrio alginolyticus]EJG0481208.1 restriction endonuclease subunit S [Vibrio alginolyticus]EJU9538512.1 restriction endonuclease subunit S [Vibrio alginolyticus]ELB2847203.1 restriction endonuclease subunit S [Vibrio alginolyticus]MDX1256788.1 restriction endonuclease subunit S [Vibrio parahaemolyticus]
MAVENLITEHIDIWTSAVKTKSTSGRGSSKKQELYGVKKLRELILELAVRGKLVPQDPNDEPAAVLLERIALEKAQLVKEKKIKKPKTLQTLSPESLPRLPESWTWSYMQDITEYVQRGKGPKYAEEGSVRVISQKCVQNSGFDIEPARYIEEESLEKYQDERFLRENDLLWNSTGTGTVGRVNVLPSIKQKSLVADSHVTVVRPLIMNSRYIWCILMAPGVQARIDPFHEQSLVSGSTKQVELNTSSVVTLPIPVAPIAEQDRIVAKVDELMELCDQVEQETEASIEAHQVLVTTLLDTLTHSADADELMQNWARISEHFDTLFTTEESIDQLKQTILQLAVMGKLVPQDPSDEPAAELLKRIAEEKAQLVKEKKIKKHPAVEPIGELGDIPQSWERIVVQDFADIKLGSTPSRHESKYWNGDIPWVSSGEVANNIIYDTNEKITHDGFMNSSTSIIPKRSLLMAIIGQGKTRGQTALLEVDACTNQNVAAFIFNENFVIPEYVWLWAKSKYDAHRQGGHGGAQPALNAKKVRSFAFPLPPTSEQKKIVERVEEIHSVCDHLAARLKEGQNTQIQLTDAIVGQVM